MSRYQQILREELKQKCCEILGGKKCNNCGEQGLPLICYDFHHVGKKTDVLSKMIGRNEDIEKIKEELKHCIILCANCHRRHHWLRL